MPSYKPMNQGTICAKVCPEEVQSIKGNNYGLIPLGQSNYVSAMTNFKGIHTPLNAFKRWRKGKNAMFRQH